MNVTKPTSGPEGVKALMAKIGEMPIVETLTMLLVVFYVLFLCFPQSKTDGESMVVTVNTQRGTFYEVTFGTALVTFLYSFGASLRGRRFALVSLIVSLASPLVFFWGVLTDVTTSCDVESIRGNDDAEYHLLTERFLQGSWIGIARVESRIGFLERMKVVVDAPWIRSFGYLVLVRPKGQVGHQSLFLAPSHLLVEAFENQAFLAYDVRTGERYGQKVGVERESAERGVWTLSPFLLLGPRDVPREEDFDELMDPKSFGRPDATAVLADFNNPNPWVREMAKKLYASLRAHPPTRSG